MSKEWETEQFEQLEQGEDVFVEEDTNQELIDKIKELNELQERTRIEALRRTFWNE